MKNKKPKQCDDRQSSFPGIQQTHQIPLGASWALDVDRPMIDTNDAGFTQVPYPAFCFNATIAIQGHCRHPNRQPPLPIQPVRLHHQLRLGFSDYYMASWQDMSKLTLCDSFNAAMQF